MPAGGDFLGFAPSIGARGGVLILFDETINLLAVGRVIIERLPHGVAVNAREDPDDLLFALRELPFDNY